MQPIERLFVLAVAVVLAVTVAGFVGHVLGDLFADVAGFADLPN